VLLGRRLRLGVIRLGELVAHIYLVGRVVYELPRLDRGPLVPDRGSALLLAISGRNHSPLHPDAEGEQHAADSQDLPAHLLAVVHLGLGGPVQELDHVLCHLRGRSRGSVVVLDQVIVEHARHGNTSAGKVGVEVEAGRDDSARRRLLRVAGQQAEDVVGAAVSRLDHERQIRGQGAVVGGARGLVVLVGRRKVVGELPGTLLDLALVVGLRVVLVLLGERLGLVNRHHVADDGAVGHAGERVAGSAHLAVDLEAAAQTGTAT
jgi:hypothetical protein